MRLKFWKKLLTAVAALDTAAVFPRDQVQNCQEVTLYVAFGAGTASGVVSLEAAHDPDYTGVWSTIGTITWAAASSVKHLSVTGAHGALRARISTVIGGGTIDVYAIGS